MTTRILWKMRRSLRRKGRIGMVTHFAIGIFFLLILASVTFRGYLDGPAILIPVSISIAAALLITGACETLFPSLYIPLVSNLGNLFGIRITESQEHSAQLRAYCSSGIQLAKSAFAGFVALATTLPSSAILYRNLYFMRKANLMLRKALRIIGAVAAFLICLFALWAVEAFFWAGAGESSALAAVAQALEQDQIISAICRENPLRQAIADFVRKG